MKIFVKIRFYWGAFVISFVTAVLTIPSIMIFRKHRGSLAHYMNRFILFLMGAKLAQEGEMDTEADMLVLNHQGIMDIIGLEALQNNNLRWVAKKELFDAFWFGNLLRYGDMISLDRSSKSGLKKLLKDVKETRENSKRAVAIFPEGTRADSQPLLPFKQGTNMIAKKLKLTVQPVVITGSKWVLNEHNRTGHSGTIHYKFLPAIEVEYADKNWFDTLHTDMQKEIDAQFANAHRSR